MCSSGGVFFGSNDGSAGFCICPESSTDLHCQQLLLSSTIQPIHYSTKFVPAQDRYGPVHWNNTIQHSEKYKMYSDRITSWGEGRLATTKQSKQQFKQYLTQSTTAIADQHLIQITRNYGPWYYPDLHLLQSLHSYQLQPIKQIIKRQVCYGLLIHFEFELVKDLIQTLYSPTSCFVLHIDLKAFEQFRIDITNFAAELTQKSGVNNIIVISEHDSVDATSMTFTFLAMEILLMIYAARSFDFTHFVLLSGNDYPLISPLKLEEYLNASGNNCTSWYDYPSHTLDTRYQLQYVFHCYNSLHGWLQQRTEERPVFALEIQHQQLQTGKLWKKLGKRIEWQAAKQWVS